MLVCCRVELSSLMTAVVLEKYIFKECVQSKKDTLAVKDWRKCSVVYTFLSS
jgi:hypothetical protein